MHVETCKKCNEEYSVTEIGGEMPGSKEPEDIRCPYCGNVYTQRSNGVFRTHKIASKSAED
ncbi:TPA: hypothetical protein NID16_005259 [Pseudomonas aeruginosa]|nr:hypothetical protein [Pseudomonas aeruginosa]